MGMRPGRFDRIAYCGLPDEDERLAICEVLAARHNLVPRGEPLAATLSSGGVSVDLKSVLRRLVSRLPRLFTSADLNALFSSAKIEAVNEALQASKSQQPGRAAASATPVAVTPVLTMEHIYTALTTAKASINEADDRKYEKIFEPYRPGVKPSPLQQKIAEPTQRRKVALA